MFGILSGYNNSILLFKNMYFKSYKIDLVVEKKSLEVEGRKNKREIVYMNK